MIYNRCKICSLELSYNLSSKSGHQVYCSSPNEMSAHYSLFFDAEHKEKLDCEYIDFRNQNAFINNFVSMAKICLPGNGIRPFRQVDLENCYIDDEEKLKTMLMFI